MGEDKSTASASSLEAQINALTETVQSNKESIDDTTRSKAIKAARGLLGALVPPPETVIHDVALNCALPMAIRMGVQLGAFKMIAGSHSQGTTSQQIARESGASVILVDQIMRVITAAGYALEKDVQTYMPSPLTTIMADSAMEATTRVCFDVGHFCTTSAPGFFRRNNNQYPGSAVDTPFQAGLNTDLSYFDWLCQNPEVAKDFQQWMTLKQQATPNWIDWYDLQGSILKDFRSEPADNILLVDIGGGEGHYLHALNDKYPDLPGRLVLQDLPQVISSIRGPPKRTELMPHDFFTAQPVKGARTYYMHWILHDWPEEQARVILSNIVESMEPGYSRLIINEQIIPDRDCDLPTACISVMMMVQVAAFERTEKQWRELLTSVGLKDISFHQAPGGGEGIIEAVK
ncbi:sterigmatocystin 8-O-methyltransferase precursor [Aspergillus affinis]|uniref:sterigmatocystin 8-O-methyltransferase precursor n=1 Tax=Aspergillus affinis TaxID=1070780 RepID=UPI0022FDB9C5|nr:sterigmatocystin 8-O-methyltransferase precursor [Aspergillus affinis]KAI9044585.1 sterigmatocystin 8-O-methyltransferase precursor [Aspergillus affinis]